MKAKALIFLSSICNGFNLLYYELLLLFTITYFYYLHEYLEDLVEFTVFTVLWLSFNIEICPFEKLTACSLYVAEQFFLSKYI